MTDNITKLNDHRPDAPPEIVAGLGDLLKMARAGDIGSYVAVIFSPDGDMQLVCSDIPHGSLALAAFMLNNEAAKIISGDE